MCTSVIRSLCQQWDSKGGTNGPQDRSREKYKSGEKFHRGIDVLSNESNPIIKLQKKHIDEQLAGI